MASLHMSSVLAKERRHDGWRKIQRPTPGPHHDVQAVSRDYITHPGSVTPHTHLVARRVHGGKGERVVKARQKATQLLRRPWPWPFGHVPGLPQGFWMRQQGRPRHGIYPLLCPHRRTHLLGRTARRIQTEYKQRFFMSMYVYKRVLRRTVEVCSCRSMVWRSYSMHGPTAMLSATHALSIGQLCTLLNQSANHGLTLSASPEYTSILKSFGLFGCVMMSPKSAVVSAYSSIMGQVLKTGSEHVAQGMLARLEAQSRGSTWSAACTDSWFK